MAGTYGILAEFDTPAATMAAHAQKASAASKGAVFTGRCTMVISRVGSRARAFPVAALGWDPSHRYRKQVMMVAGCEPTIAWVVAAAPLWLGPGSVVLPSVYRRCYSRTGATLL